MPSVGMRRTTRVFGARVLRSGRRVFSASNERKHPKTTNGVEWIDVPHTSGGGSNGKEHGWHQNGVPEKQEVTDMDIEEEGGESQPGKHVHDGSILDSGGINVYTRKRKKVDFKCFDVSVGDEKTDNLEDKRFEKTYSRRLWSKGWSKKIRLCEIIDSYGPNVSYGVPEDLQKTLKIVVRPSCSVRYSVASLLDSVLRYLRKTRIGIDQPFTFFGSKMISNVYSSHGIHFVQVSNFILEQGVCLIRVDSRFMPVFALDFCAVPFCFLYLHLRMLGRGLRRASFLWVQLVATEEDEDDDDGSTICCTDSGKAHSLNVAIRSGMDVSFKTEASHVNRVSAKLASRGIQLRSGHNLKKSSLRSKRGRPPSSLSGRKLNRSLAPNLFGFRQNGILLPAVAPGRELRSSVQRVNPASMKRVKSSLVGLSRDADSTACFANVLVMESDRCYREQGAVVTLEVSGKKQWYLAVTTGELKRYTLIAEKIMRPCSCNRFTHAIIWAADCGWKLEFPDRHDWLIFKELYKECSDRNLQVPVESCIPVPGVQEVPFYLSGNESFVRPNSYIEVKDDELTRALTRRAANYDMDSDDEQWISDFNKELNSEIKDSQKFLSDEIFELIIDAFERGFHCNTDDYSDEKVVPSIGLNVEKQFLEAVHGYWIKKRKQRRSALIRVFQCYQPRRSQLIPKSVLRKKRSFKRQGCQAGRGKQQRPFPHAEHDAVEQQNATPKVEEAKAAASRSMQMAIVKRQRAQLLMQNADMLTYKATMAVRIAEIAKLRNVYPAQISMVGEGAGPLCCDKQ